MIEALEVSFLVLTGIMIVYLVRHYVFTLTVLRMTKTNAATFTTTSKLLEEYEPFVSILIPARDEERVIGRLLQRIVELTYPKNKMEVIVIDDASSDATRRIANAYTDQYSFIKVLHRDAKIGGKGKSTAMNFGYQQAKCEIILCFDADYYPQKNIVEKLARIRRPKSWRSARQGCSPKRAPKLSNAIGSTGTNRRVPS
jgi:cellulose synthase/poly-beta-1,6-N-acetylglucosamine synthase-like glycosyltransferase